MSINADMHNVAKAEAMDLHGDEGVLRFFDDKGEKLCLFMPAATAVTMAAVFNGLKALEVAEKAKASAVAVRIDRMP